MLMNRWIRVIHSDNSVLKDVSLESQTSDTFTLPFVAAQDFLFIAQMFPFNNFFIEMNTVNTAASVMSIEYWGGTDWEDAVDLLDGTRLSGASLGRNGVIQFSPDQDEGWTRVPDTSDTQEPPELQTLTIYDLYWLKISFSNDLDIGTIVSKVNYAFSDNETLTALDPEIDSYLTAWKVGKAEWDEQIQIASRMIITELKSRDIISSNGDILRFDDFSLATAWQTLAIIYNGLGKNFEDKRIFALSEMKRAMSVKRFTLDRNKNAFLAQDEKVRTVGGLVR